MSEHVCMICRERPATHVYDDWGMVFCCMECGHKAVAEIDRQRPAPRPRILTPIDEGYIRVDA